MGHWWDTVDLAALAALTRNCLHLPPQERTELYTLRAYLRGRLHTKRPPERIRDHNRWARSIPADQRAEKGVHIWGWNAIEHCRRVAEAAARKLAGGCYTRDRDTATAAAE